MKIFYSVCATLDKNDKPARVDGNKLFYRGIEYDFTPLPIGASIDIGEPFCSPVKNNNGVIEIELKYLYDIKTSKKEQNMVCYFNIVSGDTPDPVERLNYEKSEY